MKNLTVITALSAALLAGPTLAQDKIINPADAAADSTKKILISMPKTKLLVDDVLASAGIYLFRQSGGTFVPASDPELRLRFKSEILINHTQKFAAQIQIAISRYSIKLLPRIETEVLKKEHSSVLVGAQFLNKWKHNDRLASSTFDFSTRLYGVYDFSVKKIPADFRINGVLTINEKEIENFRIRVGAVIPIFESSDLEVGVLTNFESGQVQLVPQLEWTQAVTIKKNVWKGMVSVQHKNGNFSFNAGIKIPLTIKDIFPKIEKWPNFLTHK